MQDKIRHTAITFDDVLIEPRYSEVVPSEVSVATRLTKRIGLHIPLISSPMDTVTESAMAIGLAKVGGLGVIHKNMPADAQAEEVFKVKRSRQRHYSRPRHVASRCHRRTSPTGHAAKQCLRRSHRAAADGTLVGILTRRDLRFLETVDIAVSEVMTKDPLVTATGNVTLEEAEKVLTAKKVEKLLLIDEDKKLTGLITIRDIDMMRQFPNACKDKQGRLRVGAAIGVHDLERAERLIAKDVDVLIVDSAHGHSKNVIDTVRAIKQKWDIDVIAGNVATAEGCQALIDAGADAVQDWNWTRVDLYDACRQRNRSAADHRDLRSGSGRGQTTTYQLLQMEASVTRATSPRPSRPAQAA